MSKNIYKNNWSGFSESKDAWPFATAHEALNNSRIKISEDTEFTSECEIKIGEETRLGDKGFLPAIEITIDKKGLLDESKLSEKDIEVVIIATDPSSKRSYLVFRSELGEFRKPNTTSINDAVLKKLSGNRGFIFSILATSKVSNLTYDVGDKIAEKKFILSVPSETNFTFPIGKIDPDSAEWPTDYPKTTAWFIQWGETLKIYDYESAAEDVLKVIFNEKVYNNLFHIQNKTNASHKLFWTSLSIDIFLEVASVYLNAEDLTEPTKEQNGFRAKFIRSLQNQWKNIRGNKILSYAELSKLYNQDCSFISMLRSVLHDKFEVRKLAEKIRETE